MTVRNPRPTSFPPLEALLFGNSGSSRLSHRIRIALLAVWSLIVVYFIALSSKGNPLVIRVSRIFTDRHLPAETPAKIFHFASYGLWTFLLLWVMAGGISGRRLTPKRKLLIALVLPPAVAVLEAVQVFNPAHHPALFDLGLNAAGALCGMLVFIRLRRMAQKRGTGNGESGIGVPGASA